MTSRSNDVDVRRGDTDIVSGMANDPFKALAHPLRRGIVERLAYGPTTIGEATGGLGVSKPTISKHVKVLEEAGVVVRTIDGRTHRLSLDLDALVDAVDWIDRQRAIWERMFDAVDEYLESKKAR
jgi:DNA-binding transcriptional ArsR family regulator